MLPPTPLAPGAPETSADAPGCAVHPDRPAYAKCARCGRPACVVCAHVLASGETRCAACEASEGGAIPWEQRRELGVPRAFARTVLAVIATPSLLFAQRSREAALWPTLLFGLVTHVVAAAAGAGWSLVFAEQLRAELRADPMMRQFEWLASDELYLAQLALAPLTFFLTTYAAASLWWLALRAVGGLRRPFHVIVRALSFASATSLMVAIAAPLSYVGSIGSAVTFAFGIWSTWVQIVAVSRMQGIEVRRGALAFLLWITLAAMLGCVLTTALAGLVASHVHLPNL